MPPAPLAEAPPTVPERDAGQMAGTPGPLTDAVADLLVAHAADDPDAPEMRPPALVISVRVADHLLGMAFPTGIDEPLWDFLVDDRQRLSGVGYMRWSPTEDPLLLWHGSGQSGDGTLTLALVGGWAAPTVATVALRHHGKWLVADTVEVPGADARGWAVAFDDVSWVKGPFEEVAVYDARGRLLAASKAATGGLPRAAADLRGGGWQSAEIGQRAAADADFTGMPHAPERPVAEHTVTIFNYGWVAQFARNERRVFLGAGPRDLALAGDVRVEVAVTRSLDAGAIVAGAVAGKRGVVAAGYAAMHVAAVRVVFDDGAWLEVPTRTVTEATPLMPSRIWAVHAIRELSERPRTAAFFEALDREGDVIARVPAD